MMSTEIKAILVPAVIAVMLNVALALGLSPFATSEEAKPKNGAANLSLKGQVMHMLVHHRQVLLTSSAIVFVLVALSVMIAGLATAHKMGGIIILIGLPLTVAIACAYVIFYKETLETVIDDACNSDRFKQLALPKQIDRGACKKSMQDLVSFLRMEYNSTDESIISMIKCLLNEDSTCVNDSMRELGIQEQVSVEKAKREHRYHSAALARGDYKLR